MSNFILDHPGLYWSSFAQLIMQKNKTKQQKMHRHTFVYKSPSLN